MLDSQPRWLRLALAGSVCLVIIAPTSGAAPPIAPIVLHVPYRVVGGAGLATYTVPGNCSGGRLLHHPSFYNLTGVYLGGVSASARSCSLNSTTGSFESEGVASEQSSWSLSLPTPIYGNLSARTNATLDLASASHFNARGCPSTLSKRGSAGSPVLGCEVTAYRAISIQVNFEDVTTALVGLIGSPGRVYETSTVGWSNLTTCHNASRGAWTCFNVTGSVNTSSSKLSSAVVVPWFSWNASNQRISLWSNVTGLQKNRSYVIVIQVELWAAADVAEFGLKHQWSASAGAYVHLGHGGKLLQINSVTIS